MDGIQIAAPETSQPDIVQPGCVVEFRVPPPVFAELPEEDRRFMVGGDHYIVVPDAEMTA